MTPKLLTICEIAGAQHTPQEAQKLLLSLHVGDPLTISPEPENPYDKTAVRIDCTGVKVGYVPALHTKKVRKGDFAIMLVRKEEYQRLREAVQIGVYREVI